MTISKNMMSSSLRSEMDKILILNKYYEPFVKGGGPIQSIKNIINSLHKEYKFKVITGDRDLGDAQTSNDIKTNKWVTVNNADVYYTTINLKVISKLLKNTEYDTLYLNSFFSFSLSILPVLLHKLKIIKNIKIVLAPRGEFSVGALGLKKHKKRVFIFLANLAGLYSNVRWHATAESEQRDIKKHFKRAKDIIVANNLTANYDKLEFNKNIKKSKGMVDLIFISRVHPKKNLKFALSMLKEIEGSVQYKIYGPIEDKQYWEECQNVINTLPENIKVSHEGVLNHDDILSTLQENHVFLFPTLGENYGHVISEALVGGCPVIISDQTPWRKLQEDQVGYDISLHDKKKFADAIRYYIELNNDEYIILANKAFKYGVAKSNNAKDIKKSITLFQF